MNREIKFRAWDKKAKRMSPPFALFGEFTLVGAVHSWQRESGVDGTALGRLNDLEIMQFTGIPDKNGKDIYESDRDSVGNVVEFTNGCWTLNGDRPLSMMLRDFQVIGNIHENPELLNQ